MKKLISILFTIPFILFGTPEQTIDSYLEAIKSEDLKAASQFLKDGKEISKEKHEKLKTILFKIKTLNIKGNSEVGRLASFNLRGSSIYLFKAEDKWLFTPETINSLDGIYEQTQQLSEPAKSISYFLKKLKNKEYQEANLCFTKDMKLDKKTLERFGQVLTNIEKNNIKAQSSVGLATFKIKDMGVSLVQSPAGDWLFTQTTAKNINNIHSAVITEKIDEIVPTSVKVFLEKLRTSPWLGIIAIIFAGIIIQWLLQAIMKNTILKKLGRKDQYLDNKKAYRSVSVLTMAISWCILLPLINLSTEVEEILYNGSLLVALVSGMMTVSHFIDLLCEHLKNKAHDSENKLDDVLIPMLHKALKIVLFTIGTVFIAGNLGINIASLLAGLGLGGLAFALAAKDTVENIFGSVTVLLDKPFAIGDWVVVEGVEGTVESIGLRSTKVRTFYCSQVSIPNSTLISAKVDNYGRRSYRRIKTYLSLTYDTTPDKVEAFCEGVRELIRQHPYTRKDYYHVYLNQMSASSIDVLLYCFLDCDDWAIELREKQRLYLNIMRLANRIGVGFAFPTQTLHMAKAEDLQDPELSTTPEVIDQAFEKGKAEANAILNDTFGDPRKAPADSVKY